MDLKLGWLVFIVQVGAVLLPAVSILELKPEGTMSWETDVFKFDEVQFIKYG